MKKLAITLMLISICGLAWGADSNVPDLAALGATPGETDVFYVGGTGGTVDNKVVYSNLLPNASDTVKGRAKFNTDNFTVTAGDVIIKNDGVALGTETTGSYAAGDAEAGSATSGDTATAFFDAGTIEHEYGGLEADIKAYDGLVGITGGATYNQTGTTTQIIIFDGAGAPTSAALSGEATMANDGTVTLADTVSVTNWTLTTPVLGTPQSGTLTSCTGLPAAAVVAGTFGTGNYVFDGTITAPTEITLAADGKLEFDEVPSATDKATGIIVTMQVDVNTVGIGGLLHLDVADGNWIDADANATTDMPCMAIALGTTGSIDVLLTGIIKDTGWGWTVGGLLYVSAANVGQMVQTAPAGDGDQVQVVGIALASDTILFNPSGVLVEVVV